MFVISKVVGFAIAPSNAIALLGGLGVLLLMINRRRAAVTAFVMSSVCLLAFSFSPLSTLMMLSLAERFPVWQANGRTPDGIIVLGGGIEAEVTSARGPLEVNSAGDRVFAMLDLARRYPKARIVYTGGDGSLTQKGDSEAPVAGRLLDDAGLTNGRVVLEMDSRTTFENAVFTRQMVEPKPGELWLLVTSAVHMPRSIANFRAAGFQVEAYPVDFRTQGWSDLWENNNRASIFLARSDAAMHEWAGLVALRLSGVSSELVPSPK
jgi:uncharacterized SAM-binding protein YcdF (DUF218 family)